MRFNKIKSAANNLIRQKKQMLFSVPQELINVVVSNKIPNERELF